VVGLAAFSPLSSASADPGARILGASELLLVAFVAGYAKNLFGAAEARTNLALDRVTRLSEANELLQELHRVTQTLPVGLDESEAVASTAARLTEVFHPDGLAILLREEGGTDWRVAVAKGVRLGDVVAEEDLPAPLAAALASPAAVLLEGLGGDGCPAGLSAVGGGGGLYAALRARGVPVGLVAVECRDPARLTTREAGMVEGLAEQAALALDNARWFTRLRTVGANEERNRIARDLHDHLGQSLAYLAFELDHISRQTADPTVKAQLGDLRQEVRKLVAEVRDTLHDLRTDVSESQDLVATLESFLARTGRRAGVEVVLRSQATRRLPLPQERELWRIAQEAVTNAARHGRPGCITVTWRSDQDGACLEVADDGMGFPAATSTATAEVPARSYGIVGMRERAGAIGATLDIESRTGLGTTVRCQLGVGSHPRLGDRSSTAGGGR